MKWIVFFSLILSWSCAPKSTNDENELAKISNPEVMQFAIAGKSLYDSYCANCHQVDGIGLGKLIPPIKESDYFKASVHRTVWLIRHGQKGEIVVNGETYDQPMPANPSLKPLEIAQITTYLYNIWGEQKGVISSSEVEKYLREKPENY
ncbi:Cytochrome C oxidase, cbb3-type, subunit III [Algoriphagus faecimaris]|uniref:Cytochrome C oxidase, cbb3-type, subunit III n=1 Tax=Algoriphagus faecimaris TaxID=686796 RepID=A0A1G6TL54_9BACT|nr:cytochrome c [Algoriphagus faecimaris]SDD29818.1 Cytochrome C oxidase, cbb3-type, subunit III [Algoriphagus faecimaris]